MRNYTANKLRGWDLAWPDLAGLSDVHARRDGHRAQRDGQMRGSPCSSGGKPLMTDVRQSGSVPPEPGWPCPLTRTGLFQLASVTWGAR
jgi:hypothetical protein